MIDFNQRPHALRRIGDQLCRIRYQAGLTQKELAKQMKTSACVISRYETPTYDKYDFQTLRRYVECCCGRLIIATDGPKDRHNKENTNSYLDYLPESD